MIDRRQIIEALEGELNEIEDREASPENDIFRRVLVELVEGLKALEKGEVQPIFAAKIVKTRGKAATLRKYRLKAVGFVAALREPGYSVQDAIKIVADAFAVSDEAVRKWRRELGKSSEPEDLMMMASQYRVFPLTQEDLQKAVKQAAKGFHAATIKKGT